jgi:hypothetical protein
VGTICHLTPYLSTIQLQACGFPQRVPVGVDLRLRTAIRAERDGFVEGIVRAGTHRHECLAEQREVDDDD